MPGLISHAAAENGVYIREYPSGNQAQIGVYDPSLPGHENKMRPNPVEFETHAVPMIKRLMDGADKWIFIDEIGYLESASIPYRNALEELLGKKRVIAAVRKQDVFF